MFTRSLTPYYLKGLIPAFALLLALSGNIALADGTADVQPAQEDSKKSDQQADKSTAPAEAAAAEATPAPQTAQAPQAAPSGPPIYHKLTLRLSGSMCAACLKDLQDNLLKINGIDKVKIDRPQQNYFQPVSPDVSSWAQSIIIYDEHLMSADTVRLAIKQHAYHSYRVVDKVLDHKPEEKELKF
jgi:hypothetical protein